MNHKSIIHYGGIAGAVLTAALLLFSCIDILQVQEISMEPELKPGQTILVNKIAYGFPFFKRQIPSKNDIVVFRNPDDHQLVVKRCKLLPGDPIVVNSQGWLIIGEKQYFLTSRQREKITGLKTVPENTVFVLGDNPFHSVDSRDYGFISIELIRGKVIHNSGAGN